MSKTKQADHRLVQPRPEHYRKRTREDGQVEDVLCGPYSLEQRNHYFKTMISLHMTRQPDIAHKRAQRAVFQKWRNLVFATIGDEYIPVTDRRASKDTVRLLS